MGDYRESFKKIRLIRVNVDSHDSMVGRKRARAPLDGLSHTPGGCAPQFEKCWSKVIRFVEWAQNETAVVPDFHKRILFSDKAHFWLNGYVNKQNCRICSEANPQVYVETPLHPEKLTVWCALWAGGILLQKR
ncbi:hypothetical protein TNCV_1887131 [Trichonephila clavipes]|nr:hypothetical protein TNCV_1887131 [Trichonephila clavipes]